MKIKKDRAEYEDVKKHVTIQVSSETSYRIEKSRNGGLIITKVNWDDNQTNIRPIVSNQIEIF